MAGHTGGIRVALESWKLKCAGLGCGSVTAVAVCAGYVVLPEALRAVGTEA